MGAGACLVPHLKHRWSTAMASRARASKLFPIALSPQGVADCLDVPLEIVTKAIRSGELPCYARGRMRRIPVLSVVAWIENF